MQRLAGLLLILFSGFAGPFSATAGTPAKDFSLPGIKDEIRLSDYRGKVVLLDFWASWCGPCRESFPWMNTMRERYEKQGLTIVAVNLDKDRGLADRFVDETQATFALAFDPSGKTAEDYDVEVMPSSYLIDRDGNVVSRHRGFHRGDTSDMEAAIQELLRR